MSSNRSSLNKVYETKKELLEAAKSSLGIPFKELDKTHRLTSPKGGIGQMVEENVFEYSANSSPEPDFSNLGIELKVSPMIKKTDNTYRAKERMVLNIISYMTENLDNFEKSHFWRKNKELLMMFYEHNYKKPKEEWFLQEMLDFQWPKEDLVIVKQDWKKITSKIKQGKAHELSESDTLYLGACTKGATAAKSLVDQPKSSIKAKQRAYSLKQSYVNYILNNYVLNKKNYEKLIKSEAALEASSFDDVVLSIIRPFIGMSQKDLMKNFNIQPSKQANASIINKIFKLNGNIENTEEFQKANIVTKTIRIEKTGSIKESMSFPTFKFKEIIKQAWEDSDFYNTLSNTRFMFIIFQKIDESEENSYLKNVFFWNMPEYDIEEARKCWEQTKDVISKGVVLEPTSTGFSNNLPGQFDNKVAHVRPHASKAYYKFGNNFEQGNPKDGDELPDGRWMTKQCFWLNKKYITKIIQN